MTIVKGLGPPVHYKFYKISLVGKEDFLQFPESKHLLLRAIRWELHYVRLSEGS